MFSNFDWRELRQCAGLVGLPFERIKTLGDRFLKVEKRDGAPYVLMLGQKRGALELLFSHWLQPSVSEALAAAMETPLVLSKPTSALKEIVGTWPSCPQAVFRNQCCFAAQSVGPLSAATLGRLQQLALIDLCVLVVRLGQPLNLQEQQMAESMVGLAANVKVLMVGLPSENVAENEMAELVAYSKAQLQKIGFHPQQIKETGVWYIDGRSRSGSVGDLTSFLSPSQSTNPLVQWRPLYQDLKCVVEDGLQRSKAQAEDASVSAKIPTEEVDRLAAELQVFLQDAVDDLRETLPTRTSDECASNSVANIVSGWNVGACIEGFWVRYVEELRPGTHAGLVKLAKSAFEQYVTIQRRNSSLSGQSSTHPGLGGRMKRWSIRVGTAVLAGLVVAGASVLLPITDTLRLLIGLLSALTVYAYSPWLFRFLSRKALTNKLASSSCLVELLGSDKFVAALIRDFKLSLTGTKQTTSDRWQRLSDSFRKLIPSHFKEPKDEL